MLKERIAVELALINGCQWDDALSRSQNYLEDAGKILTAIREAAEEGMPPNPYERWERFSLENRFHMRGRYNSWAEGFQACIDLLKPNANQTSSG